MASQRTRTKDVESAVKEMTSDILHCRDYGHSWAPFTAHRIAGGKGFDQVLRCTRCGTMRHRVLDRYGDVVTSAYAYADGYLIAGLGRLTGADRGTLRIASIMDTLVRT